MPKKNEQVNRPTTVQTSKFDLLQPMLYTALEEMREFSKKKQDGVLNPLKVKVINRLLIDIKEILISDPSSEYLDLLDEDTLPQNSDAVLVLGQFHAAMKQFRTKHIKKEYGETFWLTEENSK